jgi:hypothetical protein
MLERGKSRGPLPRSRSRGVVGTVLSGGPRLRGPRSTFRGVDRGRPRLPGPQNGGYAVRGRRRGVRCRGRCTFGKRRPRMRSAALRGDAGRQRPCTRRLGPRRTAWLAAFNSALEHDAWGQVEEAIEAIEKLRIAAAAVRSQRMAGGRCSAPTAVGLCRPVACACMGCVTPMPAARALSFAPLACARRETPCPAAQPGNRGVPKRDAGI